MHGYDGPDGAGPYRGFSLRWLSFRRRAVRALNPISYLLSPKRQRPGLTTRISCPSYTYEHETDPLASCGGGDQSQAVRPPSWNQRLRFAGEDDPGIAGGGSPGPGNSQTGTPLGKILQPAPRRKAFRRTFRPNPAQVWIESFLTPTSSWMWPVIGIRFMRIPWWCWIGVIRAKPKVPAPLSPSPTLPTFGGRTTKTG